ncbi:MAG: NAD(P)/FAD-dependent oxidoreductase [Fimbriimonas ginsengisoli]|uniref:Ferredoxin--NADP reductase n=1 Tax=Fimbriimonas ginsengisoli TaxID=1005039 RepID=A0A931LRD2_FIMGI|nr:NAD(P)/FAD-dependent oxidoreductase [Fimbriimonas ginsengisoli]
MSQASWETVDVTIIGGGPVGLFAAFYAGMRGMSARILDSLPELGGQLTALYPEKDVFDMPGFTRITAKQLAKEMAEQGTQFGADLVLGQTAQDLVEQEDGYVITTAEGARLPTRTLIIAAGAGAFTPTRLGVPREAEFEGRGLSYGVLDKAALAGKRVAIVGGGDSAFDWCLNLAPIASEITLIHRRDQFRAHEDSVRQVLASNVKKHLWSVVRELHGDSALEGITVENTQTKTCDRLEVDALVVNVGFKSSLGPIKAWGLTIEKNLIVVDPRFETNRPRVFAVGDVCTFPTKLKLIATGVGEAVTAICFAKTYLDPDAKLFPGHSSDMDLFQTGHS